MRNRILSLAILTVVAASANAQTFSADFEAPGYNLGNLVGQNAWTGGGGTGSPTNDWTVTNNRWFGPAASGQSALHSYSGSGASFRANSQTVALGNAASGPPILNFSGQVWVDGIAAASADRYFGLHLGTGDSPTTAVLGIALDLKGQLRAGYGYFTSGTGFNGSTSGVLQNRTIADFVDRWVGLSVSANRSTGGVTFTFSNLGTSGGASVETFTRNYNFANSPGTLNIARFGMVSDWVSSSANSNGSAYFDNLSLEAVPEPMTMTVLALGAVAALRRRNRKS